MDTDTRKVLLSTTRLTLVVLGLGLVTSVLAGLVLGLITRDLASGMGVGVAVGMSVTAVVGVALNLLWHHADDHHPL